MWGYRTGHVCKRSPTQGRCRPWWAPKALGRRSCRESLFLPGSSPAKLAAVFHHMDYKCKTVPVIETTSAWPPRGRALRVTSREPYVTCARCPIDLRPANSKRGGSRGLNASMRQESGEHNHAAVHTSPCAENINAARAMHRAPYTKLVPVRAFLDGGKRGAPPASITNRPPNSVTKALVGDYIGHRPAPTCLQRVPQGSRGEPPGPASQQIVAEREVVQTRMHRSKAP